MQTVLTDIRVVGHELRLSLENIGSFIASDYAHTFPLQRIPENQVPLVRGRIFDAAVLRSLAHRNIAHSARQVQFWDDKTETLMPHQVKPFYDLIQLDAPLELAQTRCFPLGQLQQHCLQHSQLQGLEKAVEKLFRYLIENPPAQRPPYSINALRQHVSRHPEVNGRHRATINRILGVLEAGWPIEGEPDQTPKVRLPAPLPPEFHRGEYTSLARWKIAPRGSVVKVDDALVNEIRSGQKYLPIQGRLRYLRARTAEELRDETMAFFDIEMPLFKTPESQVSWVASMGQARGARFGHTIHTIHSAPDRVGEYTIIRCADERDLVQKVKNALRHTEARTITVYNAPFDTIQLREAGEFTVGDDETEPKKVATLLFFERIGIKGKDVLDLLRWARVYCDYLPNKKLVMVGKHLLGEHAFKKEITYAQQAQLECICQGRDPSLADSGVQALLQTRTAPEVIASYVGKDVLVLADLVDSKPFQESLDDIVALSQLFRIDPFLLLHDEKRVQDYLGRKFFEKVGTFREVVHPRFKTFVRYEQRVKEKLKRTMRAQFERDSKGILENVTKAYLPLGSMLRSEMVNFFPELREFYAYADAHGDNSSRRFFLAQYEDALAEWMWQDYAAFLYERDKFHDAVGSIPPRQFHTLALTLESALKKEDKHDLVKKAIVSQRDLQEVITPDIDGFMKEQGLDLKLFRNLFAQWCRVRQKNRILWGAYETGWKTFDSKLEQFCTKISRFLEQQGLEVVHAQNRYIYVRGNPGALYHSDSPLIPALRIPRAYRAGDKIYYPLHGFVESFKREDHPTHYLSFYEMNTFGPFLDLILEGNEDAALLHLQEHLHSLKRQEVPAGELVWRTASTGKYRAFEDGGEIHFYDWKPDERERTKVLKGKEYVLERQSRNGRDYIEEPYLKQGEIIHERRFIMTPAQVRPDWGRYWEKAVERARELVLPILGKDADSWFDSHPYLPTGQALNFTLQ